MAGEWTRKHNYISTRCLPRLAFIIYYRGLRQVILLNLYSFNFFLFFISIIIIYKKHVGMWQHLNYIILLCFLEAYMAWTTILAFFFFTPRGKVGLWVGCVILFGRWPPLWSVYVLRMTVWYETGVLWHNWQTMARCSATSKSGILPIPSSSDHWLLTDY